eukprot:gene12895-17279_t
MSEKLIQADIHTNDAQNNFDPLLSYDATDIKSIQIDDTLNSITITIPDNSQPIALNTSYEIKKDSPNSAFADGKFDDDIDIVANEIKSDKIEEIEIDDFDSQSPYEPTSHYNNIDPIKIDTIINVCGDFHLLHGAMDYIMVTHILSYFNAVELSSLSCTCHYLKTLCSSPILWLELYKSDFAVQVIAPVTRPNTTSNYNINFYTPPNQQSNFFNFENIYIQNRDIENNNLSANNDDSSLNSVIQNNVVTDNHHASGTTNHISQIIMEENNNELEDNYSNNNSNSDNNVIISGQINARLNAPSDNYTLRINSHDNAYNSRPLLQNNRLNNVLGSSISTPLITKSDYIQRYHEYKNNVKYGKNERQQFERDLNRYGMIEYIELGLDIIHVRLFAPFGISSIFLSILLFCMKVDGYVFLWIPLFILFACLTAKLDGQNNHSKSSNIAHHIQLTEIFTPFWVIEGFVLINSLIFLGVGINRYRRGLLERIDEHLVVFSLAWGCVVPIVIFQSLLCVRDANQLHLRNSNHNVHISATESVIPILILIGIIAAFATLVSCVYKTSFQVDC